MVDVFGLLSGSPAVSTIIGTRIYPLLLPTAPTLPAIEYSFISCTQIQTFDNKGTQRYRVEVNCWGKTYADSTRLRDAVIGSLNGLRVGDTTVQFCNIQDFPYQSELDQYRCMVEFYIYTAGLNMPPATARTPSLPGASLDDFTYTQSLPSDTWTVTHGLGRYVSVTVLDSSGNLVVGQVHYDSLNQLTLTFSAAFGGTAYLV